MILLFKKMLTVLFQFPILLHVSFLVGASRLQAETREGVSTIPQSVLEVCVWGKKSVKEFIVCFSTCYYSGPNQPASQSGASGHLETLLCL